jgi:hypothetical protein
MRENKQNENQSQELGVYIDLCAKLRDQKVKSEQQGHRMRFDEGVHYAQKYATYDKFSHLEELEQLSRGERHLSGGDLVLGTDIVKNARDIAWETMREGGVVDETVFWDGWLAGIISVWEQVKHAV